MLNSIILVAVKAILLVLVAPLVTGVIAKVKNIFRMRKGAPVFQPYYNALKLFSKSEVISKHASWIFRAAPVAVFITSLCALILISAVNIGTSKNDDMGLLIAAFFVLGLGRFFMALAGLDAAGSFGGMGSSREMFISSLAEPSAFISVFVLCVAGGTGLRVSNLLAGAALFLTAIAETSRVPVDNRETHLELTMVHEAMAIEYSGRSLALIELAGHIKQIFFFMLLSWCFFAPLAGSGWGRVLFPAEIAFIGLAVAITEISVAKMRLFRVVDFLGFSIFIALAASVAACMGL